MGASRIILFMAVLLIAGLICSPASAKEITVGDGSGADFRSIQEAVNSSSPGDTITVRPGTYRENIIVNVTWLTVRSESGTSDVTVKALDRNESIFLIKADNVTLNGFNITGAGESFFSGEIFHPVYGIYLDNASSCAVIGNTLLEDGGGIYLYNASYNIISENLLFDERISLSEGSATNTLIENIIEKGCILVGAWSSDNLITGNKISNGTGMLTGIAFACCGAGDVISGNTILNCSSGIDVYDRSVTIRNNTIIDCSHGIELSMSGGTGIYDNTISNCSTGIHLGDACSGVRILSNTIASSTECGIFITDHENNETIYNNYFNNSMNIRLGISEGNVWNNSLTLGTNIVGGPSLGGNFWADPNGTGFSQTSGDYDLDGICDIAYEIDGSENIDYLPLSTPPDSVPITVGDNEPDADYHSIQKAVSAAKPGSTILVYPGTYRENVVVDVEGLKIYSRSINPEEVTVESPQPEENVFYVSASNVTICGFTVKGTERKAGGCIYLDSVYGCSLCNNTLLNNRYGISLSSSAGNILRSNNVTENTFGIVLLASINNTLAENRAKLNHDSGIYLNCSDNNSLVNNTAYNSNFSTGPAIYLSDSGSNLLSDNKVQASFYGILMASSENNTITRNSLRENTDCGILLSDSEGNTVYDNYFNNIIDVRLEKSGNNTWNISRTRGANYMGGPYQGGNFWAKPDGSGFSETVEDSDIDGIGNSAYNIENTGIIDSLPLAVAPGPVLLIKDGIPVEDFLSIQDAVNSAVPGSTILVYPGIYEETVLVDVENLSLLSESDDPGSTVIRALNDTDYVIKVTSKGITISGFYISGTDSIWDEEAGIWLYNTSDNSINKNMVSDSFYGVHLLSSDHNNITNNVLEENQKGLYLENSKTNLMFNNTLINNLEGIVLNESGNNSIENNMISRNREQGVYIYSSDSGFAGSNLVTDNLILENNYGIYTSFSRNDTVRNNMINFNAMGITLLFSRDNLFRDNLIESSRDFGLYMSSCNNSTFYNNFFNNTLNISEPGYGNKNISWNITKIPGKNIADGSSIGGNFWATPGGTGFSQNCTDLDKDGICDSPYKVNDSEFDHLPLCSVS